MEQELDELRKRLEKYETPPSTEADKIEEQEFADFLIEGTKSGEVSEALETYVKAMASLWERYRKEKIRFRVQLQLREESSAKVTQDKECDSAQTIESKSNSADWDTEKAELVRTIEVLTLEKDASLDREQQLLSHIQGISPRSRLPHPKSDIEEMFAPAAAEPEKPEVSEADLSALNEKVAEMGARVEGLTSEVEQLQKEKKSLLDKVRTLEEEKSGLKDKLKALLKKHQALKEECAKKDAKLTELQANVS